jgi:hypothetical protein
VPWLCVGRCGATTGVGTLAAGVTGATGGAVVVGATDRRRGADLLRFAGDGTTTFCGGGGADDREPTDGGCTVPESSRSAIAPAPSSSAVNIATAHRAVTQSPFPRSLAGTGLSFPPCVDPSPVFSQGYKKPGRTATRFRGIMPCLVATCGAPGQESTLGT